MNENPNLSVVVAAAIQNEMKYPKYSISNLES